MENEIQVLDINIALNLLKQGEILLTSNGKKKSFVVMKKENVYIQNDVSSYTLSFEEFQQLFGESKFIIFNPQNDGEVDLQKDEEYYSMDVLKY